MDRSEILTLVSQNVTQNNIGAWEVSETERNVYCSVESVSREEFFAAGRTGLNPEYRFTIFAGDYADEKTVIYKDMRYGVYRTYHAKTDLIELYVARKGDAADYVASS